MDEKTKEVLRYASYAICEARALIRLSVDNFEDHHEYQVANKAEEKICQLFRDNKWLT